LLTLTEDVSVVNVPKQAFSIADEDDVPTAFIIYTIKGYRLHIQRKRQVPTLDPN